MEEEKKDEIEEEFMAEESVRQLLANLELCQDSCVDGMMHSLEEGGDFAEVEHVRWLADCAEICQIAKNFFLRDSEYAGDLLSLCADICEECAESCEKFFEDERMKHCAEVCKNCAKACREMIEEEEDEIEIEEIEADTEK